MPHHNTVAVAAGSSVLGRGGAAEKVYGARASRQSRLSTPSVSQWMAKRGSMSGRRLIVFGCVAFALFGAALAHAAVIVMAPEVLHDLSNGGTVTINNATYLTVDQQPTGSGVI